MQGFRVGCLRWLFGRSAHSGGPLPFVLEACVCVHLRACVPFVAHLCLYVCRCVGMSVHVGACLCVCLCVCVGMCVCVCVCVRARVCVCVSVSAHLRTVCCSSVSVCVPACLRTIYCPFVFAHVPACLRTVYCPFVSFGFACLHVPACMYVYRLLPFCTGVCACVPAYRLLPICVCACACLAACACVPVCVPFTALLCVCACVPVYHLLPIYAVRHPRVYSRLPSPHDDAEALGIGRRSGKDRVAWGCVRRRTFFGQWLPFGANCLNCRSSFLRYF